MAIGRCAAGLLMVALAWTPPARAQLGTVNNPPPQNLYRFGDTPQRLNNGLGTMAERRAELARIKRQRTHRPAPVTR